MDSIGSSQGRRLETLVAREKCEGRSNEVEVRDSGVVDGLPLAGTALNLKFSHLHLTPNPHAVANADEDQHNASSMKPLQFPAIEADSNGNASMVMMNMALLRAQRDSHTE